MEAGNLSISSTFLKFSLLLSFGFLFVSPQHASAEGESKDTVAEARASANANKMQAAANKEQAAGKKPKPTPTPTPSGECEDTGYVDTKSDVVAGDDFTSVEFDCNDAAAKDAAMQQVLDHYNFPQPGCTSGGCEKRKKCGMTGIISPNGDPLDFQPVKGDNGKCQYQIKAYQDGPAYIKAECGCE